MYMHKFVHEHFEMVYSMMCMREINWPDCHTECIQF